MPFPPTKASRSQRTAALQAATGVRVGTGHAVFEPDQLLVAGVGYSAAWAVCRPPYDDSRAHAALDDSDAAATCHLTIFLWRVPSNVHSAVPRVLHVSVPRLLFNPIASTEAPDHRAILLAGSDGTVAVVRMPAVLQPGDEAAVAAEVTELPRLSVSGAVCHAGGEAGSLYIAAPGSTTVTVATLDTDGAVIVSELAFAEVARASGERRSGGGWIPNIFGMFGRGSAGSDNGNTGDSPAPRTPAGEDKVVAVFARDQCCVVETASQVIVVEASGESRWRLSKESCNGRAIADVFDAAVTASEVWLLVRPHASRDAAVVSGPRDDASRATLVDMAFPVTSTVAARRNDGGANAKAAVARLHVVDDANCCIVGRTATRYCCVAGSVRAPRAEITEEHPGGVFVFASAAGAAGDRIELVTNHGVLSMRRGAPEDIDASMTSLVDASGAADASGVLGVSNFMHERTPPPAGRPAGNVSGVAAAGDGGVASPVHNDTMNDTMASIVSAVNRRERNAPAFNFDRVAAAASDRGADAAWSHASDDVATKLVVNPSNWAKGDLSNEDTDGIAFVTKELHRRLQHHAALVEAAASGASANQQSGNSRAVATRGNNNAGANGNNATAGWDKLQPQTQAVLLSRTESLAAFLALRECYNAGVPGADDAKLGIFRDAVALVAQSDVPADAPAEASPAELVFFNADRCATFLAAVNEASRRAVLAVGELPLGDRVAAASAAAELWSATLDALETTHSEHAHLVTDSNRSALWTARHRSGGAQQGFLAALEAQALLQAQLLREIADAQVIDGATEQEAIRLVRCLARVLHIAMRLSRSDDFNASLLFGTVFCAPFFAGRLGYPHGSPRVAEGAVASAAAGLAADLARTHAIMPVLFAISAADQVPWDRYAAAKTPDDVPEWHALRDYCAHVPGFFAYVMQQFIESFREGEIEAVPRLIPGVLPTTSATEAGKRVDAVWRLILEREAPDVLWMIEPTCDAFISASRAPEKCRVSAGDGAAEHRANTLALAQLALVAEGVPQGPRGRLQLEQACAAAQQKHLPQHADRALAADEIVRLLLEEAPSEPSSSAWADASRLASLVPQSQEKHDLSLRVLCRCFRLESADFVQTARDQNRGDRERMHALDTCHTGRAVLANPLLVTLINTESDAVVTATSQEFAGALRAWLAAKHRN